MHVVLQALVPPTSKDMVIAWMDELGTTPKPGPKSEWAPLQQPLPNSLEAKAATAAAAAAPAAKKSSAGGHGPSGVAGLVLSVGVVAAATLL
jgi:hypothetical protein